MRFHQQKLIEMKTEQCECNLNHEEASTIICTIFYNHLTPALISAISFQLSNEVDVGFVKPKMAVGLVTIGGVYTGSNTFSGVYISCVQLHKKAIDENLIKILELCPNRHGKFLSR